MRKMLCEIDLEKARGYPGRYLEHFSTTNRAPAYAKCRESIAKLGSRSCNRLTQNAVSRLPKSGQVPRPCYMKTIRLLCPFLILLFTSAPRGEIPGIHPGVRTDLRRATLGYISFTDTSTYNSYDFHGSPIGFLETKLSTVDLQIRMDLYRRKLREQPDSLYESTGRFDLPYLVVGRPEVFYAAFHYRPTTIEMREIDPALSTEGYRSSGSRVEPAFEAESLTVYSLPLQRFGFSLASGVPGGILRFGLVADAFYGVEGIDTRTDRRVLAGLKDLSFHLGSQLHDIVRLGFVVGASGYIDTLYEEPKGSMVPAQDRFVDLSVPKIGGSIDVSGNGLPVYSNFSFIYGKNRFLYVTKLSGRNEAVGVNRQNSGGSEDALVGDSITWDWQTLVDVNVGDFNLQPAMRWTYWRNAVTQWEPTEENDNPFQFKREKRDSTWEYRSLLFGIGTAARYRNYGTGLLEVGFGNLRLEYGRAFQEYRESKRPIRKFNLGLEGNMHSIPALRFPEHSTLHFRLGYLFLRDFAGTGSFRSSDIGHVNTRVKPLSQYRRYLYYHPDFGRPPQRTVSRFSWGLAGSFLDELFAIDFLMAFPSTTVSDEFEYMGFEFALNLGYTLKAN